MALICPVCSAENREGANFCRNCGGKLAPAATTQISAPPGPSRAAREWAATAPAQLRAPTVPAGLFDASTPMPSRAPAASAPTLPADEKTVIAAPGHPQRPPSPASSPSSAGAEKRRSRIKATRLEATEGPSRSRGIWLWLGLLVVALAMIVAGWYGFGTRKSPAEAIAPPPVSPPPVSSPAPAAPPVAAAVPESPPAKPPLAMEAPAPAEPVPSTPPAAAEVPSKPAPAVKSRKQATTAAQPGAPETPAPAVAAAPPPPPAAPADPQALCAGRNFIAKAQCMAAQCLKSEYKAQSRCEAVRRQ